MEVHLSTADDVFLIYKLTGLETENDDDDLIMIY